MAFGRVFRQVVALSAFAARADVKDGQPWWPSFHGPLRDNVSRETGLMKKWPEGGPRLVWKRPGIGLGYSGVSLAEGRIFTAGDFDDVEKVIALDLDNCHGSVTQAGGYLYGSSCRAGGRGLFCAELLTGRLAFREKRMEKLSLTAAEGLIYGLGQEGAMHLVRPTPEKLMVALDRLTGKTVWVNDAAGRNGRLLLADHRHPQRPTPS